MLDHTLMLDVFDSTDSPVGLDKHQPLSSVAATASAADILLGSHPALATAATSPTPTLTTHHQQHTPTHKPAPTFIGLSSSSSAYSASGSSMSSMSSSLSNSSRASASGSASESTGSSSRLRSESGSSTRSRSDSFAGRHGRFSSSNTNLAHHQQQHSGATDLISSSSLSSAIGISSLPSIDSHPTAFSTTPSALFSASSSLSSMSTPQNYKNVKPLQDAFSSTGLASKKLRATGKRPRASAPGSLPLTSINTPMKPMPDTPVKSKASRSQSFISLRHPPVSGLLYGPPQAGALGDDGSGFGNAFSRRHARISTENSSHMRRAVSAGVVSTPPRSYETMFNEAAESSNRGSGGISSVSGSMPKMLGATGMRRTAVLVTETSPDTDQVGRFARQFTILSVLGSGEFSEAVEVEERSTRMRFAVKRTKRPATGSKARLRRLEEVDILRELSRSRHPASASVQAHPNIVSLIDAWEEEGHLFMQLELCPLGNFADFLEEHGVTQGPLDEPRLWKVLAELVHGLDHIHSNGILHLDLKPANVFITAFGTLKIGDFGLASRWPRSGAADIVDGAGLVMGPEDELDRVALTLAEEIGSPYLDDMDLPRFGSIDEREKRAAPSRPAEKFPRAFRRLTLEREGDREYLAPEIMSRGQYGKAADMFSLGILMLEAAANVDIPDNGEAYQKLRNDDFSDVDLSPLSEQLVDIITGPRGLLRSEPSARPTTTELEHNALIVQVREWMDRGLSKSEERRFVLAAATRHVGQDQSPQVVHRPLPNTDDPDPFLERAPPLDATLEGAEMEEPPRTANRACFADSVAFTTPVNGFKVLFPPPPHPGFPSTNLSPISDMPSSQEAGDSPLLSNVDASSSMHWRGAIVEEDYDLFMQIILGPNSLAQRTQHGLESDDIEMSF